MLFSSGTSQQALERRNKDQPRILDLPDALRQPPEPEPEPEPLPEPDPLPEPEPEPLPPPLPPPPGRTGSSTGSSMGMQLFPWNESLTVLNESVKVKVGEIKSPPVMLPAMTMIIGVVPQPPEIS